MAEVLLQTAPVCLKAILVLKKGHGSGRHLHKSRLGPFSKEPLSCRHLSGLRRSISLKGSGLARRAAGATTLRVQPVAAAFLPTAAVCLDPPTELLRAFIRQSLSVRLQPYLIWPPTPQRFHLALLCLFPLRRPLLHRFLHHRTRCVLKVLASQDAPVAGAMLWCLPKRPKRSLCPGRQLRLGHRPGEGLGEGARACSQHG